MQNVWPGGNSAYWCDNRRVADTHTHTKPHNTVAKKNPASRTHRLEQNANVKGYGCQTCMHKHTHTHTHNSAPRKGPRTCFARSWCKKIFLSHTHCEKSIVHASLQECTHRPTHQVHQSFTSSRSANMHLNLHAPAGRELPTPTPNPPPNSNNTPPAAVSMTTSNPQASFEKEQSHFCQARSTF